VNKYFLKIPYATSLTPSSLLARAFLVSGKSKKIVLSIVKYSYGIFDSRLRQITSTIRRENLYDEINGQMWQDAWVISHLPSPNVDNYFVDIGAAYPRKYSNTYLLQFKFGWSGVLVEPNPYLVEDLRQERLAQNVTIVQSAVGQKDGKADFLEFGPLSSLIESSNLDIYGDLRKKHRSEGAETFSVDVVNPKTLLRNVAAPKNISLLSVDVEGLDLEILKAFPFSEFNVHLVCVEHNYDKKIYSDIVELMHRLGFIQECKRWSGIDAWFARLEQE
jgi:FkbM family methyltransferase